MSKDGTGEFFEFDGVYTHVWANVLKDLDQMRIDPESIQCDLILLWMTADGLGSVSLDLQGALAQLPWRKKPEVFPRFLF